MAKKYLTGDLFGAKLKMQNPHIGFGYYYIKGYHEGQQKTRHTLEDTRRVKIPISFMHVDQKTGSTLFCLFLGLLLRLLNLNYWAGVS